MSYKLSVIMATSIAVAMVACMLAGISLSESKSAARQAAESLSRVMQMQKEIIELRGQEINAHLVGEQPTENSSAWVEYGRAAGISDGKLVEINRLPLKQIAKTAYSRDEVFIRFVDISASNTIQFLIKCRDASIGYSPVSVHMAARPSKLGELENWNVSLVLTRLLYTAKKPN